MFNLYNRSPKQNLIFYRIYIRPLVDSWLIDISNLAQISNIEAKFLKTALNLKCTTKHTEIYKQINIPTIAQRALNLATSLIDKEIIVTKVKTQTKLRSRSINISEVGSSLCANLSEFCARMSQAKPYKKIAFDENAFIQWRRQITRKISQKTKMNKYNISK